jgi:subtilisin family serine protease
MSIGRFTETVVLLLCVTIFGAAAAQEIDEPPARIVVKLRAADAKPGETAQEVLARLSDRPSDALILALSTRAGTDLLWVKALGDGSHVFFPTQLGIDLPVDMAIERLQKAPEVTWAEEDVALSVRSVSDPYFRQQWSFAPSSGNSYGVDFVTAWQTQQGDANIRIAVIDTGILPHPDLVGPGGIIGEGGALASGGYDFISDCRIRATCPAWTPSSGAFVTPQPHGLDRGDWVSADDRLTAFFSRCRQVSSTWHGSHTAGTVAALADNGEGVAGGAFGAKIVPVRVLGKCGGYMSDVAEAIRWAAGVHPTIANPMPAHVLNLSLGALGSCGITLQSAIDAGSAAGALVVVAAGNDATEASRSVLPSCSKVVAVAASTKPGDLAFYSNYSATHVALSAPGGDTRSTSTSGILSLSNSGGTVHDPAGWTYIYAQGTSSSAPHVAAAAALMLSRNPKLAPAQLMGILTASTSVTAFPAGSSCATKGDCGAGLLNVQRAVSNSLSPLGTSSPTVDFGAMSAGSEVRRELYINNRSTAPISLGLGYLEHSGFSFYIDECSGQTLAESEHCRVVLSFAASSDGPVSSAMHMPTESGVEGSILVIELVALVGSRLTSPTPAISLGDVRVGETKRVTVAFQSRLMEQETLGASYLVGNSAVISKDDCSGMELAATAQCYIEVSITPLTEGELTLQLVANTAGEDDIRYVVNFAGNAVPSYIKATSEPTLPGNGKGNGGGGALSIVSLLAMVILFLLRFPRAGRGQSAEWKLR